MKIDIVAIIRHKTYELLEEYVKNNKTGFAYIYLIMSTETKNILCGETANNFYGVTVAVSDGFELGEIIIK